MRGVLDRRRIGAWARLPLWCAAALLTCALFSTSGCAGCSAEAGTDDLLATTEQAQQTARADVDGASAEPPAAGKEAGKSEEPGVESANEASESGDKAVEQVEEDAHDAAPAETSASASGKSSSSKPSGGSGASRSRSASGSAPVSASGGDAASGPDQGSAPSSSAASDDAPAQPSAISAEVVFDSSNAAAYNSKFPSSLGTFTVELPAGATVYDALVATGVAFSTKGGNYIDSIGGIAEKQCGAGSGWMYAVNGSFPGKSAMKLELADGDKVRWAYTVTMGDV